MGRLRGGYDLSIQNVFTRGAFSSIEVLQGGLFMPLQETPHGASLHWGETDYFCTLDGVKKACSNGSWVQVN